MKAIFASLLALLLCCCFFNVANASNGATNYPRLDNQPQWPPSHRFDVQHIKLALSFDEAEKMVIGHATTTIQPLNDNFREFELNAVDLTIERVALDNGRQLAFQAFPEKLAIQLDRAYRSDEKITFTIDYTCHPRAGVFFIAPDQQYPNRPYQIWSQGESIDNRHWFPGYDYPNDKATSEMLLTVKEQYTAISNGKLLGVKSDPTNHTRTFHWRMDRPHSSYLISFVVGEFVEVKDQFENIPVSFYVYRSAEPDARRSFGKTVAMMKFYSDQIGYRYPYDKYSQVTVADYIYGGMENITATTLTDETIHPANLDAEQSSDGLVAHELAHQWWGDLITCRDWSHTWLNEGFATFFGGVWAEHDKGRDQYAVNLLDHFKSYTDEEEHHYRRPIVCNRYYEIDNLFDSTTYQKGALVLNMLRWLLGPEQFWKGINHYAHKFEFQNADTNDFKVAMEEATGENLDWFFDEWLYKAGYPEFVVDYDWDEATKLVHLTVRQVQTVDDLTPYFRTPIDIEIVTAEGSQTRRVQVLGQQQDYYLQASSRPLLVRFDPTGSIIKQLKFNRPLDQILYQLNHSSDALGRIEAARDLRPFLNDEKVVAALAASLVNDQFWGVRAEVATVLGESKLATARAALIAAYKDENFNVRSHIVEALGNFNDEAAFQVIETALQHDNSDTVVKSAAATLGKSGSPRAFDLLSAALSRDSHREVIRSGVFAGLSSLKDPRAIPFALKWSAYGAPTRVRTAAIKTLGDLGKGEPEVLSLLIGLLDDPIFNVRRETVDALKKLSDGRAVAALGQHFNVETDGRIRYAIRVAIAQLKTHNGVASK